MPSYQELADAGEAAARAQAARPAFAEGGPMPGAVERAEVLDPSHNISAAVESLGAGLDTIAEALMGLEHDLGPALSQPVDAPATVASIDGPSIHNPGESALLSTLIDLTVQARALTTSIHDIRDRAQLGA